MQLVPAKCTQCGAVVQVNSTQEKGVCSHCGMEFFVEKAINNYTTNHNYIIQSAVIQNIKPEKPKRIKEPKPKKPFPFISGTYAHFIKVGVGLAMLIVGTIIIGAFLANQNNYRTWRMIGLILGVPIMSVGLGLVIYSILRFCKNIKRQQLGLERTKAYKKLNAFVGVIVLTIVSITPCVLTAWINYDVGYYSNDRIAFALYGDGVGTTNINLTRADIKKTLDPNKPVYVYTRPYDQIAIWQNGKYLSFGWGGNRDNEKGISVIKMDFKVIESRPPFMYYFAWGVYVPIVILAVGGACSAYLYWLFCKQYKIANSIERGKI